MEALLWKPDHRKGLSTGDWRDEQWVLGYHNGGTWPFICGFYIAALVAAKRYKLAEKRLIILTHLIQPSRKADVPFAFNEWHRAQDGIPQGEDRQTWSAAMDLNAAVCVAQKNRPFFDEQRQPSSSH
jgi:glycogen debranching enzyme